MAAELAWNRVHKLDCVKGLARLEAGSVDLAFADPPFNIGYDYDEYDDAQDREKYLAWSKTWIEGVRGALKPSGAFWLAIGDEYAAELKIIAQELGFHCRSWVVWYYTFGVNCKKKFTRSHAHIFHFVKDERNFTFNDAEVRVPSARMLVYGDKRADAKGRLPDDTWILRPQDCSESFTAEEDTWYFPRVAGTFKERAGFHGCQMPEQLLGRILRACSNPGERVLDPFTGSGTTLVVAKKLGREFLGFELSDEYAKRSQARIEAVAVGEALVGAAEPLMSAPATSSYVPSPNSKRIQTNALRAKAEPAAASAPAAAVVSETRAQGGLAVEDLVEAFRRASHGYSADRVVADPALNQEFLAACRKLGLSGSGAELNRGLFRARKAGKIAHVATERRTEYDWPTLDKFLFASEIAWSQMLQAGIHGLDELLCDPELAARFDRVASTYAPGFKPFDFRWGALKLRKEAKVARDRAESVRLLKLGAAQAAAQLKLEQVPCAPGIYTLGPQGDSVIYAGSTLNLRERFRRHFTGPALETWKRLADDLTVRFGTVANSATSSGDENIAPTARRMIAYQFALCEQHHTPELNAALVPLASVAG